MSKARFYGQKSAQVEMDYAPGLLAAIDEYIRNRKLKNPQSSGIDRAFALRQRVERKLLLVEGLSERQLMWRMFDYVFMPRLAEPFGTSKVLRLAVLEHLCNYLRVSNQMLAVTERKLREEELKLFAEYPLPLQYYQSSDKVIREKALRYLITTALQQVVTEEKVQKQSRLMEMLKPVFAENSAEKIYNQIEEQWVNIERLNHHQLQCRVSEQLYLTMSSGHGVLGDESRLRMKIAKVLSESLDIDAAMLRKEIDSETSGPFYLRSPFGPIYETLTFDKIMLTTYLQHIDNELHLRAKREYVEMPLQPGKEVELSRLASK